MDNAKSNIVKLLVATQQESEENKQSASAPAVSKPWFSLDGLKPYFDVTTEKAKRRILSAMFPLGKSKMIDEEGSIDLYNPFWILVSLIIMFTLFGNLLEKLSGKSQTVQLEKIYTCAGWILFYIIANPLIFYCLLKNKGGNVAYLQIVGIYGYSFAPFVLFAVLYVINLKLVHILLVLYVAIASLMFLYKNLGAYCEMYLGNLEFPAKIYMVGCVFVLLLILVYKVY